jgi:hypothetical protein
MVFSGGKAARIFLAGASGSETTGGKAFVPLQARLREKLGGERRRARWWNSWIDRRRRRPNFALRGA